MTRLDEGRLRAFLDGEIPELERDDVEAWIREEPGQWLWAHRRWKDKT